MDPQARARPVRFRLAGTGHPIAEADLRYVGTFQLADGALVFHVFILGED